MFLPALNTYRILQENLQDPTRYRKSAIGLAVIIFKGKNQRLASLGSNKEVGAELSHNFQVKRI